jgi:hypothetical protein
MSKLEFYRSHVRERIVTRMYLESKTHNHFSNYIRININRGIHGAMILT